MYDDYFEKELLTVDDVMDILYLGKNTVYGLPISGELNGILFGRAWRILKDSIQEMIERKRNNMRESSKFIIRLGLRTKIRISIGLRKEPFIFKKED